MWLFLLGLFCGEVLGIIILALFRGSCSNDMEDFYSENESDSDEKDAHDR